MGLSKKSAVLLVSAARIATPDDVEINFNTFGISLGQVSNMDIIIDATAITATPSVQPRILGQDPASGKVYDLLASIAAITGTGTTVLKIGKDVTPSANVAAQTFIPSKVIARFTHGDADSITYSVGINVELDTG